MSLKKWLQSQVLGTSSVFSFQILNPNGRTMYDDLLAPDLAEELSVFPVQERSEGDYRVLELTTNDKTVTADMILNIFRRHGVKAEVMNKK